MKHLFISYSKNFISFISQKIKSNNNLCSDNSQNVNRGQMSSALLEWPRVRHRWTQQVNKSKSLRKILRWVKLLIYQSSKANIYSFYFSESCYNFYNGRLHMLMLINENNLTYSKGAPYIVNDKNRWNTTPGTT